MANQMGQQSANQYADGPPPVVWQQNETAAPTMPFNPPSYQESNQKASEAIIGSLI